jgi:hypothetical protein
MSAARRPPLWTCPRCGHRFASKNLWHSCGRHRLADHFKGADPAVKRSWDRFVRLVRANGPVTIYAQKTRIVCMVRVRFAGAQVRRRWLLPGMWLKRKASHPALVKVERIPPNDWIHRFRIERPEQMDAAFEALLKEAYAIGCQEHRRNAE